MGHTRPCGKAAASSACDSGNILSPVRWAMSSEYVRLSTGPDRSAHRTASRRNAAVVPSQPGDHGIADRAGDLSAMHEHGAQAGVDVFDLGVVRYDGLGHELVARV